MSETTERLYTYVYHEQSGYAETLDAEDMDEAVEMATTLCREGDWGDCGEGASISVWVTEHDADGEETDRCHVTVEIEPDHEYLIGNVTGFTDRSCGDSPDDHEWTSEGEGGCRENPGVWSVGGTQMLFLSHCKVCGLHRREISVGSQYNPGEHDTVEYTMPDTWCEECEQEECTC